MKTGLVRLWPWLAREAEVSRLDRRLDERYDIVGGCRVFARIGTASAPASAPAIVLVHGLVVSGRSMVPTAERLAPWYRVYVPDLPGFGRSGETDHALDVSELADVLARWMDAAGLDVATLLGSSFGCQIIAEFAVRYPARLTHAVLVAPVVEPRARSGLRQVARLLLDALHEPPRLLLITLSDFLAAGPRRSIQTADIMLQYRIEERLPSLRVPALVVRGTDDPIVPGEWAEQAARLLPDGHLVAIRGSGHDVNYDAPVALAQAVRGFLVWDRPRQLNRVLLAFLDAPGPRQREE